MTVLSFRPPERAFLGYETEGATASDARAVVIPFPLEASVTYGGGTRAGPEAIIKASAELELFDEESWSEPFHAFGIATLETPAVETSLARAIDQVEGLVCDVLGAGKFPLVLGGEHSLSIGATRPFVERYGDLAVLQFDAHADLRDGYRGEPLSHASAMRRILERSPVPLVSVGVRSISAGEAAFLQSVEDRVTVHWAKDLKTWQVDEIVAPLTGRPIYVTFDVDGFDASLMPATGTPEPGGFFFSDAMEILRAASQVGTIVGADMVELAPMPGYHAADFTAAKVVYRLLSYALTGANRV